MSSHRSPRASRQNIEQVLDGAPARTDATRPLAALLHAATAPAQVHPGEDPHRQGRHHPCRGRRHHRRRARIDQRRPDLHRQFVTAPPPPIHRPPIPPTHTPAETPRNGDQAGKSGDAPSPSMAGLCKAYEARKGDNAGKALDSPAFTALITAAGDKDNVDDYCDAIAATNDHGQSDDTRQADQPAEQPRKSRQQRRQRRCGSRQPARHAPRGTTEPRPRSGQPAPDGQRRIRQRRPLTSPVPGG
jgi:hypothetical protein